MSKSHARPTAHIGLRAIGPGLPYADWAIGVALRVVAASTSNALLAAHAP